MPMNRTDKSHRNMHGCSLERLRRESLPHKEKLLEAEKYLLKPRLAQFFPKKRQNEIRSFH